MPVALYTGYDKMAENEPTFTSHRDAYMDAWYSSQNTNPTPEQKQAIKDLDVSGRDTAGRYEVSNSGQIHVAQKKMSITRMAIVGNSPKFSNDEMVCHYNPETVRKSVSSEYIAGVGTTGVRTERFQFKEGKANTWSMVLLFSTWGDEFRSRHSSAMSVKDSLNWLEETIRPSKTNSQWGERTDEKAGKFELFGGTLGGPPPVFVNLFDEPFVAFITSAEITYKKLSPLSGEPIWAEVSVNFTEFVSVKL